MNEDGRARDLFLKRLLPLVIVFIILFSLYHIVGNFMQIRRLESEVEKLQQELQEAENRQQELQLEVERLDDPEYIERIARSRLGLVRPGEELFLPYEAEEDDEERGN